MTKTFGLSVTAAVAATAAVVLAQQEHEHGPLTAEQLGSVHFETTCAAGVRQDFDRAVALLHSFEFRPALEAFTKVASTDSSCAIAYWGIALCQWGNPFAGVKTGPILDRG